MEVEGITGEIGFVTTSMKEDTFAAKAAELGNVLSVIRVGK